MTHKLALTDERRATFGRQALDRFDRHEAMLLPAVQAALDAYVVACRPHVQHELAKYHGQDTVPEGEGEQLVAASPQPESAGSLVGGLGGWLTGHAIDQVTGVLAGLAKSDRFANLLGVHVLPVYNRMLDEILAAGLSDGRIAADLQQWRGKWLEERTQALLGVPDFVTGVFRTQLRGLAERKGTSVDDARQAATQLLSKGYESWKGRAQLIARTETVGANNQGTHAAWSALSHATGEPATKEWLDTPDRRTRKTHKAAARIGPIAIDEDFVVGSKRMNGPGDNRGGAAEVCNCRCTMIYGFPGSTDKPGGPARNSVGGAEHAAEALVAAAEPWTWALALVPEDDEPDETPAAEAAEPEHQGVAIMLGLSAGDEAALLTTPGVPEPEPPGLHCTLAYLANDASEYTAEQLQALAEALGKLAPEGTADAFATATFNPDDPEREPCAVLLVQSQWLSDMHDKVGEVLATLMLDQATTFPIWVPHVAVAYNTDVSVIPAGVVGQPLSFNRLVVGVGDQQLVVAGDGALDPTVDTAPELTAAGEDPTVTAPADVAVPDEATGGDTPAPAPSGGGLDLTPHGQQWEGVMMVLDAPSGDGRIIASEGLRIRPLPLPLSWQRESGDEHDDSVVVGRVLSAEVRPDPELGTVLWGTGDYLDPMLNYDAQQAMAQVEQGLGLCSVDLAVSEIGYTDDSGVGLDPSMVNPDQPLYEVSLSTAFGGVTITSFPAFEQARLHNLPITDTQEAIVPAPAAAPTAATSTFAAASPEPAKITDTGDGVVLTDGTTVAVGDPVGYPAEDGSTEVGTISGIDAGTESITITPPPAEDGTQPPDTTVAVAMLVPGGPTVATKDDGSGAGLGLSYEGDTLMASSALQPYTAANFDRAEPDEVVPLTVDPETGAVFGHLATWGECHVGKLAQEGICQTAPHSITNYADFHLGSVLTDAGMLDVGRVTVGTGHAQPGSRRAALSHYDNTGAATAVVRAKDGNHGVWLCGQVIHDTPAPRIEEMMRSPLSGDWRMREGNLELCAALAVNVPGFPVRRPPTRVGKLGTQQVSLVAAGVVMPDAGRTLDAIGLPSGTSISRADFESLVAAAAEVIAKASATPEPEALRLRTARARLALR